MSLGEPREHHETIGSTNERARELAEEGAAHGTLVTAGEQTAGRGRQGRGWVTPPGVAIAASLVLRDFDDLLPLRAGLAVADVAGPSALVKWPNDVWVDGKKVAGILVEARGDWAVLGIGVNVALDPATLPPEVAQIAGTLGRDASEIDADADRAARPPRARAWARRRPRRSPRCASATRCSATPVRWDGGEGEGAGIDDAGGLLVRLDDGTHDHAQRRRGHPHNLTPARRWEGMDLELDGRVAVVTGASKGIGLAIARTLAAEGMTRRRGLAHRARTSTSTTSPST